VLDDIKVDLKNLQQTKSCNGQQSIAVQGNPVKKICNTSATKT
jgi:hypothetical protein